MSTASPASEIPAAEYKLFVREDSARFYFRNKDEGIYLSPKGLGWFIGSKSRTRDWNEIEAVNLRLAHVPKQGPMGTCKITFRDGKTLTVLSASAWGASDAERSLEYGRFLTDFHRVLPMETRDKARFGTGATKFSHAVLTVVFVFAVLFFVGLPAGLTIYFREWEGLLLVGAGLGIIVTLYRVAEKSAPASYDPSQVPPDFYP